MISETISMGGRRLAFLLYLPDRFTHMVIICHGFRGTRENGGRIHDFARRLNDLGLAVVAFDFSGSGQSQGDFAETTLSRQVEDLQIMIKAMRERYHQPILLLGRSFGGSTVLASSLDLELVAFILWSTPVLLTKTFQGMLRDEFAVLKAGRPIQLEDDKGRFTISPALVRDFLRHDFDAYVQALGKRPVLVVHGQADETVALENAELINKGLDNSELVVVPGADHRFTEAWRLREDITLAWIARTLLNRGETQ